MPPDLSRREFLEVSAAAGLTALTVPVSARVLTREQRSTLLSTARTVFPHRGVSDEPYLRAVAHVEQQCRCDFRIFHGVKTGVERLEWLSGWDFAGLPESTRVRLLKRVEHTSFFRVLYREILEGLYGSPESWRLLTGAEKSKSEQ